MTFGEQATKYLSDLRVRKKDPPKPTTIATFESLLRSHAIPFLGSQTLAEIDNESLRALAAHLADDLGPRSVNQILTLVRKVIKEATDSHGNRLYQKDWNFNYIDAPSSKHLEAPAAATAEQIEAALRKAPRVVRELLATVAATGMRRGEALALQAKDFDADAGTLDVHATRSRLGTTLPKTTSSKRVVNLAPDITVMLSTYLDGRRTDHLFPVTPDQLRWAFDGLGIKTHGLRRYRISWLRYRRCHEDVIRYWAGHTSESQTDAYVRLNAVWNLKELANEIGTGFNLTPQRTEELEEVHA